MENVREEVGKKKQVKEGSKIHYVLDMFRYCLVVSESIYTFLVHWYPVLEVLLFPSGS